MKVILVNGSPHEKGCTYTALKEIENTLNNQDIETEIFWLGNKPISGCLGCGSCLKTGKCFINDKVNEFLDKVEKADDQINKYFAMNNMPIVTSQYWNMVHGNKPEEVEQDLEGMQTMRTLANNMAWLLKCINAGKKAGIELPKNETITRTNFIR